MARIGSAAWIVLVFASIVPGVCGRVSDASTDDIDLLKMFGVPNSGPITYTTGADGYPAMKISSQSNIAKPADVHFGPTLQKDFAIVSVFKSDFYSAGFFFSVVSPDDVLVFGLQLAASSSLKSVQHLILYYTEPEGNTRANILADFNIPIVTGQWTKIALKVEGNLATLYLNCEMTESVWIKRSSTPLALPQKSMVYVGHGGKTRSRKFSGSFQVLRIYKDPRMAQGDEFCDSLQDGSGSGDTVDIDDDNSKKSQKVTAIPKKSSIIGDKGERGMKGNKGEAGPQGPQGLPGICKQGSSVCKTSGVKGEPGIMGMPGAVGRPGFPGQKGDPGVKGERGLTGPTGYDGVPGKPGPKGGEGAPGLQGNKGDRGMPGPPGPPGKIRINEKNSIINCSCKGARGPPGPPGLVGLQGLPGEKGTSATTEKTSLIGEKGEQGIKGAKGDTGSQGKPGSHGPPGPPGPPGIVETGNQDDVNNEVKGEGNAINRHFARTLNNSPKGSLAKLGINGEKGERGIKGDRGEPGESITGPKGEKGDAGLCSENCPSREEIQKMVRAAAPRTSKIIADGVKGQKGAQGPQGIMGFPGTDGSKGEAGARGSPGARGPPGDIGIGLPGLPGKQGLPGPPGKSVLSNSIPSQHQLISPSTYKTQRDLIEASNFLPVGSLAFVIQDQSLFVKVQGGLRPIKLGMFIPVAPTVKTTAKSNDNPVEPPSILSHNEHYNRPRIRLVALNHPRRGNFNGVAGADHACYREAQEAGLHGTFRAFLSSNAQNLESLIVYKRDRSVPVVNLKNVPIFNSWYEIINGTEGLFNKDAVIYSFNGQNVLKSNTWPQKYLWHGTTKWGKLFDENFCHGWHSRARRNIGMASSLNRFRLLQGERFSCHNLFVVLCIEISSTDQR